jgi:apolipoprotein N-acyltransferase
MTAENRGAYARSRGLRLAAAGGGLCFLGFVGFGVWPLALICLAPLWQALEEARRRRLGAAALLGYVFGLVAYAGGFHWMWRIVDVFLGGDAVLGALLWLADSSAFALRFVLYAVAYVLVRRRGWPVAFAAVAPLLAVEWLYPALFPVYLGHALAGRITVIQISDLTGPLGLTAVLAAVNAAFFETWRWLRAERRRPDRTWGALALAAVFVWLYGSARLSQIEEEIGGAPALRVGVVQGNLGVFEKGREAAFDHRLYLQQTRELLAAGEVDLVVWPETVYTRGLRRPLPLSGRLIREDVAVPLLFGAASIAGETGRNLKFNSALLVGADGVIRTAYDKNLLIPFTEYVPFAGVLAEQLGGVSEFSPGTQTTALRLGAWRISTPICHEAAQASFVRRMVAEARPHLIATLANDSWFGDSQEPWLHLTMARLRAVEHRRYLVRATNSGVSVVVDPAGRDVTRSGLLRRENLRATVRLLEGATVYTRCGDWLGWVAAILTALALALPRRASPAPGRKPSDWTSGGAPGI